LGAIIGQDVKSRTYAHLDMIEGLESRYRVGECSFNTIFGFFQGYKIFASRKVAEQIEKQTHYAAIPFSSLEIRVAGDPTIPKGISCVQGP
jgi:hypothetical protein